MDVRASLPRADVWEGRRVGEGRSGIAKGVDADGAISPPPGEAGAREANQEAGLPPHPPLPSLSLSLVSSSYI